MKHAIFDFDGIVANTNKLKINLLSDILSYNFKCPKKKVDQLIKLYPGLNRGTYIDELEKILLGLADNNNGLVKKAKETTKTSYRKCENIV